MGAAEGFYRRQLPHWQPEGVPLFITWRLHGSLPASIAPVGGTLPAGLAFVAMDRQLDAAERGLLCLKEPKLARMVAEALVFAANSLHLYELLAWVIMANHVHIVVLPKAPLWRITKAVKGFTARQANQLLGRTGQPFWQHESYDHWVRGRDALERTIRYVEMNPVSAGLVSNAADWPWSSAT
jgi:REP element-mobilizing transposase RayT